MTQKQKWSIALTAAVAGGIVGLYLVAPDAPRKLQRTLASQARERSRCLDDNLRQLEASLSAIEQQLHEAREELVHRLDEAKQNTLEQHVPGTSLDPEDWKLSRSDLDHDLPRIPGR